QWHDLSSLPRGCADGRDADPTEEQMAETERNEKEQFECQELLECQVQVGAPEEEEDAGLVAEAEAVAAGWMLDFLCLSLPSFPGYYSWTIQSNSLPVENDIPMSVFDKNSWMIWGSTEKEHDKLHEEIQNLIKIQSIAVCMENGNFKEAEVFERIFGDPNSYMPLKSKLLMIISQKDTFHSFFQHFSCNHMMEKIKSYVNYVLSEKSSTFLMKAAAKAVESKRTRTITSQDKPNGSDVEMETEANLDTRKRSHKNLFLYLNKKERRVGTLQSTKKKKESRRATESRIPVSKSQPVTPEKHRARKRQAWLWEEDKNLRSGVRKYGEENWSKILLHCKFNNRTSVMLKDRWRTMKKLKLICSDSED
uniref:Telomeric repeat-binding factor n=1 Tax=Nomascus leucogenys TaxID=61853 RepID=A0A2I3HF59_NOMLE